MQYDILLTKQPANGYLARPILMPELVVSGADEQEVLDRVREVIAKTIAQSRIVQVNVPTDDENDDENNVVSLHSDVAKLQLMECAASDPLFLADLQETMQEFVHADAEWWESGA